MVYYSLRRILGNLTPLLDGYQLDAPYESQAGRHHRCVDSESRQFRSANCTVVQFRYSYPVWAVKASKFFTSSCPVGQPLTVYIRTEVTTHQSSIIVIFHEVDHLQASQYSQITDAGDIDRSRGQSSADPRRLLQLSVWSTVVITQQTSSSHQRCGSSHPLRSSMRPYPWSPSASI